MSRSERLISLGWFIACILLGFSLEFIEAMKVDDVACQLLFSRRE